MAVTLASNTTRREQSRLALLIGDELVAPLVLSLMLGVISRGLRHQGVVIAREAQAEVIKKQGEHSRLYLSSAGLKASHEAATLSGKELLDRNTSQAVLNTARSLDVVRGWSAVQPNVSVQVANLVMPIIEKMKDKPLLTFADWQRHGPPEQWKHKNTLSHDQFRVLTNLQKCFFLNKKGGGKIDRPAISRSTFDTLSPNQKMEYIQKGRGKLYAE